MTNSFMYVCNLQVKEAGRKNFKISDEEIADLKTDAEDVNLTLEECKKYLDEAENEINMLESDINSEVNSYGIKIAAKVTGIGAVLMIGGGTLIIFWTKYNIVVGGPYTNNLHSMHDLLRQYIILTDLQKWIRRQPMHELLSEEFHRRSAENF